MPKRIPFVVMSVFLFLVIIWILLWVQSLGQGARVWGLNRDVAIGVLASVAASCAFYAVLETGIHISDSSGRAELTRLSRFEDQYGISDALLNKSGDNAIELYRKSIQEAKIRVWAMGISNNQFIDQHWTNIKARKLQEPLLNVTVLFFDPESTVSRIGIQEGTPLINLFDFPEATYNSDKRASNVHKHSREIALDSIRPSVYLVTLPSYFSMMVVDDRVFFFPFLAIAEDAASHPILVLDANKNLGERLVKHFIQLTRNTLLCRKVQS